jgi:hypothetical protein
LNSSWLAEQSIPHTTLTFYSDCVKMCEDFVQNFDNKKTGCYIMIAHHFTLPFSPGNFWPKTTWLSSLTHPTFLFPQLKIKLEGRHFDIIEVIEAETHAVLNTHTEHDFQDALKNSKSAGNGAYSWKGTTSMVRVVGRPKVSFLPKWQHQS